MVYLHLMIVFFKTGLFTIGGGLAALPLLQVYLVHGGWVTQEEFIDMIAIAQSTPGPIGINMATFAGYKAAGMPGALVATISMVTPSFVIILIIARFLETFASHPLVKQIMRGLRPAAMGMIAAATWLVTRAALYHPHARSGTEFQLMPWVLFTVLVLCYARWRAHPLIYIAAGAVGAVILRWAGLV